MNSQKINKYLKLNRYKIVALVIVISAVAIFAVLFIIQTNRVEATASKKPHIGAAVPSQFTFSGASGWWQGATRKTDVAIFPNKQNCFVSFQHISGNISAKQASDEASIATLTSQGHVITQLGAQDLSIKTNTGIKQYQLQQINVSNPSGGSVSGRIEEGQESAYIPLSSNDFIYIEADCDTSAELQSTIPVLQAVSFDANRVK